MTLPLRLTPDERTLKQWASELGRAPASVDNNGTKVLRIQNEELWRSRWSVITEKARDNAKAHAEKVQATVKATTV